MSSWTASHVKRESLEDKRPVWRKRGQTSTHLFQPSQMRCETYVLSPSWMLQTQSQHQLPANTWVCPADTTWSRNKLPDSPACLQNFEQINDCCYFRLLIWGTVCYTIISNCHKTEWPQNFGSLWQMSQFFSGVQKYMITSLNAPAIVKIRKPPPH